MVTDDSIANQLSGLKWSSSGDLLLSEFAKCGPLPQLARLSKDQRLNSTGPNANDVDPGSHVLVHSVHSIRSVVAQITTDRKGKAPVKPLKVLIPEQFDGFFEILSEEGKPVKCIDTVQSLSKRLTHQCLVRAAIKAILPDSTNGEFIPSGRTRLIREGEILTPIGYFIYKGERFLRCLDESDNLVYLKGNQKGHFSPIAGKDAITGVHYLKNILQDKRLPLTVRLVTGSLSALPKSPNGNGLVVLRLQRIISDKIVILISLQHKNPQFRSIPLRSPLRLTRLRNHQEFSKRPMFRRLCLNCDEALPNYLKTILLFSDVDQTTVADPYSLSQTPGSDADLEIPSEQAPAVPDEEIDRLYAYIRGLAPLPSTCVKSSTDVPPPPPPVETLPSRLSIHSKNSKSSKTSPTATTGSSNGNNQFQAAGIVKDHPHEYGSTDPVRSPERIDHPETTSLISEDKVTLRKHANKHHSPPVEDTITKKIGYRNKLSSDNSHHKPGHKAHPRGNGLSESHPVEHPPPKTRTRPVSIALGDSSTVFPTEPLSHANYDPQRSPLRAGWHKRTPDRVTSSSKHLSALEPMKARTMKDLSTNKQDTRMQGAPIKQQVAAQQPSGSNRISAFSRLFTLKR